MLFGWLDSPVNKVEWLIFYICVEVVCLNWQNCQRLYWLDWLNRQEVSWMICHSCDEVSWINWRNCEEVAWLMIGYEKVDGWIDSCKQPEHNSCSWNALMFSGNLTNQVRGSSWRVRPGPACSPSPNTPASRPASISTPSSQATGEQHGAKHTAKTSNPRCSQHICVHETLLACTIYI